MSQDEQRTGGRGELPVTADLPGDPDRNRHPTTDRVVFGVTAVLTLAFVVWGATATDSLEDISSSMLNGLIHNGGWAFMLAASGFVVFALWLAVSRYGKIALGQEGEEPEFRTVSWVAMMFSAGMGIGLMFYGVSEPLSHFTNPPPGTHPADAAEAMQTAMATTLFHWTLHPGPSTPWSVWPSRTAPSGAAAGRRSARSSSPSSEPGTPTAVSAKLIDILAIFATLFGSAASLGLGALQIGSGFHELHWKEETGTGLLVLIIAVLTVAFVASAISGVEKGIQWLSNTNMVLALILAVFVFVAGPTIIVLDLLPTSIAAYFGNLAQLAGRTEATGKGDVAEWLGNWTVFYWAWWISWTPFVGMFIARISRGRTIRQFIGGVILVPSTVSLVWFAIFGGTAINLQEAGKLGNAVTQEAQLFGVLQQFPIATVMSLLVMILVGIFFVSGADAASIVMGTLSQKGILEPAKWVVVFWGVVTGAVAAIMLLIGNGKGDALAGLQNLTILVAAPFTVVMIGMCVALMRDLRQDPLIVRREFGVEAVESAVIEGHAKYAGDFEIRIGPGGSQITTGLHEGHGPDGDPAGPADPPRDG